MGWFSRERGPLSWVMSRGARGRLTLATELGALKCDGGWVTARLTRGKRDHEEAKAQEGMVLIRDTKHASNTEPILAELKTLKAKGTGS